MTCSTCYHWTPKPTNTPAAEKEGVRIMARYHACERINPTTLRFAREALGLVKQSEAA